ncbi:glycosyltransferase family 2 protein [Brachybacterium sp. AOP3-A1-3]|uniref:glycosyltransferase family 2 protein n=1 Tax=Brachybacterium sp. AOP3-A1-3 TaxID=3457699 RepID=UPI0040340665
MRSVESVVVGMATFRRPDLLAALLPRVVEQIEHAATVLDPAPQFRVLVVDNDPDASGRNAAAAVGDPRITYVVERQPGISSARNRLLDEAAGSDVLVLLDDDETPHDGWLVHHLSTYREHDADAVCGPVHAVFEGGEDPWIAASGYYLGQRRTGVATGTVIRRAATNNLLLDMARVQALGLRFDPRFGLTGGEDSLFTGQLTAAGGKIVVCAESVVDDLVPAARNTRRFNLSRRYAQASSHVRVDRELAGSLRGRFGVTARWAVIGAGQILKGLILAGFGGATRDLGRRAPGESKVASGLGVLAGCLGIRSRSYGRPRRRPRGR